MTAALTPLVVVSFLVLTALALAPHTSSAQSDAPGDEAARLRALIEEDWEWRLRDSPTLATSVGDRRYDDRWPDLSPAAIEARKAHAREVLERVEAIDRERLPEADRLDYDLFLYEAQLAVQGQRFPAELLRLSQMDGVYSDPASTAEIMPLRAVADYANLLRRLERVPELVDQHIALLERGVAAGVTPPRVILREVPQLIANQIVDDPVQHPVWRVAFAERPSGLSEVEWRDVQQRAAEVLRTRVVPAYRRLHEFVVQRYLPGAAESVARRDLPDGEAWYAFEVRRRTTTDLTPDEIHDLGLAEVRRIRAEMEALKEATGFTGTLEEFFDFLRSDPRFFFSEEEALVAAYRDVAKRIDPGLPRLFGTLPRLTYGVVPVPEYSERTQTTAYYRPGSPEIGRPGLFYANTYDLPARPRWEMEALTLHEAVPGHHLQIALAQELEGVPAFRRHGGTTAFVEGWALYAESLGEDLGLYRDPYAKFGQLTYEMWRAVRLVIDTGLHAKGWSREQAIDFFKANAGKTEHDIVVEVDRYIAWPGQALAYKVGELKIRELRRLAEKELGDAFDVRAFHDLVLGAGSLPLQLLEDRVTGWIAERRSATAR